MKRILLTLRASPGVVPALIWILLCVVVASSPGLLATHAATTQNLAQSLHEPFSGGYLFGTDELGRDLFSRILLGTRIAFVVAFSSIVLSGLFGSVLGIVAGYFGGRTDTILMRVADLMMAFPGLLLALFILLAIGSGVTSVVIVLAIVRWPLYARIVRAATLSVRAETFVAGARLLGASTPRILVRHIFPNIAPQLVLLATLELARVMLLEASLSFLGMGVQPPDVSWGTLVADGQQNIQIGWWLVTFPGLWIFLTALSFNVTASWLRDVLDPTKRWRLGRVRWSAKSAATGAGAA